MCTKNFNDDAGGTGRQDRGNRGKPVSDITGQRFGRLTALYHTDRRDPRGSVIWHCRCECGNEIDVSYNALRYGNMKSCGCRKKEHDQELRTFLTHVAGTSVEMLRSRKLPTNNTTGIKGVYLVRGKYMAKIVFQKKQYFLGTYDNIEDAAAARREAEELINDVVVDFYTKWTARAKEDPAWAEANPVSIRVERGTDQRFHAICLPEL